jgi:hypothetical protein
MNIKVYPDSTNYTCQIIELPKKQSIPGLDNLVGVNVQGNLCLIGKDSPEDELYLFFPAESQISDIFLNANNLYRNSELNLDKTQKGFFEENKRVKAIKFRGNISSGFVIPARSLRGIITNYENLQLSQEFNSINDIEICKKYVIKTREGRVYTPKERLLDKIIESKFAPEHFDTSHLMKNIDKISLNDEIVVSYKLHGTSARYYNTLVNRQLSWIEKILQKLGVAIQTQEYKYVAGSRKVIKSVDFEELGDKKHYYSEDLWSKVGKEYFEDKLYKGEAVYCEIIGSTYEGEAIQKGYTYGYTKPIVFIYRISNINAQGIEVDLSYSQMLERAKQLDIPTCPELFKGTLQSFLMYFGRLGGSAKDDDKEYLLNQIFYEDLLEAPSTLDCTIIEEGFCIRIDKYPKPEIYKIKSKQFLLHEGNLADKEEESIEDAQS